MQLIGRNDSNNILLCDMHRHKFHFSGPTVSGSTRGGGARGGKCSPKIIFCLPFCPPVVDNLVAESHGCRNHTGRGATFVKSGQMLKNLSWIGKIVKIYETLLKKLHFGRSGKNFW